MRKNALVSFCLFFIIQAYAQVSPYSLSPDWYFGTGGRLTFPNGNYPTSGTPATGNKATNTSNSVEASTSVCFNNGSVALYTNTQQVYNANPANAAWTDYIRNLVADNTCSGSSTGGGVAFPDPASPANAFYLVMGNDLTSGSCANKGVNRYRFTGTGTAVAYNAGPVNIETNAFASEAITVGTDGTGGYWLVLHDKGFSNIFRVWHYTSGGITGPTDYNKNDFFTNADGQSYLKISPCQDKIAFAGGNTLVVNEFNRTTGAVGAELRRVAGIGYGVGLEFSPDGSRVFYSGQGSTINYVNIASGATGSVAGSGSWSMQMGPDGKIYASPGGSSIGVVSNPNGSPSYSTLALPGGATTFRGLSNIAWLTPNEPAINQTVDACEVDFSHLFENYFLEDIGVNNGTFLWNFGDGNTSTSVAPTHTYAGSGTYNVTLTFNDATCGHTWSANATVNTSCPAPVTWLDVSANNSSGKTEINWSTATELNNDYFEILRSDDGINFYPIGTVKGVGNSQNVSNYQFDDLKEITGSVYYQVRQYDLDGTTSSSKVVHIATEDFKIYVKNNPTHSDFSVYITGNENYLLTLTDMLGRIVYSSENVTARTEIRLGEELPAGNYILMVTGSDQKLIEKLIKQ